jgi:class 3 adenylate cyclase
MKTHTSTFRFLSKASHPKNSIALMYDLEGFSKFFNQPDVQHYVPAFLNTVSRAVDVCLYGGKTFWKDPNENFAPLSLVIAHEKFMGDGALYIMLPKKGESDFSTEALRALCNRLWNLKNQFSGVVKSALDDVPVFEVPQRIRFGVSRGSVYELQKPNTSTREFIGFCINQASRLQSYCPDLGFVASARLMIPDKTLKEHGYRKVVAKKIKGFPNEVVIVDNGEFEGLSSEVRADLFSEL